MRQRRRFGDESEVVCWLRSQVVIGYDTLLPTGAVPQFRRNAETRAVRELRGPSEEHEQDFVRLDLQVVC